MFTSAHYPFPGVIFTHQEQFKEYCTSHSDLLDYRFAFEKKLSTKDAIVIPGICPLTRERTYYSTSAAPDSRRIDGVFPIDWQHQQLSTSGVPMGDRAIAHYALATAPKGRLGKTFYLSNHDNLSAVLSVYCDSLERGNFATLGQAGLLDTILVSGQMEHQDDPLKSMQVIYSRLTSGGRALFHINFHYFDAKSIMRPPPSGGTYWAIGWDFLDKLRLAGFVDVHAITFWAEDAGYLGPFNFVFFGSK